MIVHPIGGAPHNIDVLMWDALESEWRIGHFRDMIPGVNAYPVACTMREADDLIECDNPVPVFEKTTHWSPLPPPVLA